MKRVLILHNHHMLLNAVEALLLREEDLIVLGCSERDSTPLSEEIKRFSPEVVIMEEKDHFYKLSSQLEWFREFPNVRFITVNLQDNRIKVYERQEVMLSEARDLIAAIHRRS